MLRLRDGNFRNWFCRRVEEFGETPRDRLLAMFDTLGEWFQSETFRGCMFMKASAEFQDHDNPINVQTSKHKRLLLDYAIGIATDANATDPAALARQLMLLKHSAIVIASMTGDASASPDARKAAEILVAAGCGAGS